MSEANIYEQWPISVNGLQIHTKEHSDKQHLTK